MVTATRDGKILSMDKYTPQQIEDALCIVFRAFLEDNPELLTGGQDAAEVSTASA